MFRPTCPTALPAPARAPGRWCRPSAAATPMTPGSSGRRSGAPRRWTGGRGHRGPSTWPEEARRPPGPRRAAGRRPRRPARPGAVLRVDLEPGEAPRRPSSGGNGAPGARSTGRGPPRPGLGIEDGIEGKRQLSRGGSLRLRRGRTVGRDRDRMRGGVRGGTMKLPILDRVGAALPLDGRRRRKPAHQPLDEPPGGLQREPEPCAHHGVRVGEYDCRSCIH